MIRIKRRFVRDCDVVFAVENEEVAFMTKKGKRTIRISGWALYKEVSTMPPLMVSVVLAPRRKAPPNSQKQAMIKAWARVMEPEPTEVAKELATSLAPIP